MHDVEIVTHCWKYARSLAYQMSGLILDPPKCEVQLTIYWNEEDEATRNTITTLYPQLPVNVHLAPRCLDKPRLFRRAIGRNEACLQSLAGACLILTDADYVWPGGAIDEVLARGVTPTTALTFPHHYYKQIDHETGDSYLERQVVPKVLPLNPKDFEHCRIGKAIGGIQVYDAHVARKYGYLNGTKWMTPHRGEKFACCRCDRGFRGWIADKGYEPKDFDGGEPWRIRHSKKGREFEDVAN